ncbi:MAG: energy transducer TonB [Nitrospiraceae bacterium]
MDDRVATHLRRLAGVCVIVCLVPFIRPAAASEATHESDHAEDADVLELPEVHVHGIPLNKDQQQGPVPKLTPWPKIPSQLDGTVLDDWMKARFLVKRDASATVVVLEPAKHRELTQAGLQALNRWTFAPQMKGDEPVDGELTVRIHFRSQ